MRGREEYAQILLICRLWRIIRIVDSVALATTHKMRKNFDIERSRYKQEIDFWRAYYLHEREKKVIAVKMGALLSKQSFAEQLPPQSS